MSEHKVETAPDITQVKGHKVTLRLKLQQAGLDMAPKTFWIISAAVGTGVAGLIVISFNSTVLTQLGAMIGFFVGSAAQRVLADHCPRESRAHRLRVPRRGGAAARRRLARRGA